MHFKDSVDVRHTSAMAKSAPHPAFEVDLQAAARAAHGFHGVGKRTGRYTIMLLSFCSRVPKVPCIAQQNPCALAAGRTADANSPGTPCMTHVLSTS